MSQHLPSSRRRSSGPRRPRTRVVVADSDPGNGGLRPRAPPPSATSSTPTRPCRPPGESTEWHRYFTASRTRPPRRARGRSPSTSPHVARAGARGRRDPSLRRAVVEPARGAGRDGGAAPLRADAARGPVPEDPDSPRKDISGAWLSFSASGDVTAPVVYANSGNPADYDAAARRAASTPRARSSSSATRTRTAIAASRRSPPSARAPPA